MKTFLIVSLLGLLTLGAAVYAQGPGGYGPGWGMGGPGMMGPGMMGGQGWAPSHGQLTEENTQALARQYAHKYLKGYKVERVLPFAGMGMTMIQAELKGANGETRLLHINPWGNVMPFGGAQTRGR